MARPPRGRAEWPSRVAPALSETAPCTRTFICFRLFGILPVRGATSFALSHTSIRSLQTACWGRKEPCSNPQPGSLCIHSYSVGSVFCRASALAPVALYRASRTARPGASKTASRSNAIDSPALHHHRVYLPSLSHSAMRSSSGRVAPKSPISRPLPSGWGAHTPCRLLPRSIPATVRRTAGQTLQRSWAAVRELTLLFIFGHLPPAEHVRPGWPIVDSGLAGRAMPAAPTFNCLSGAMLLMRHMHECRPGRSGGRAIPPWPESHRWPIRGTPEAELSGGRSLSGASLAPRTSLFRHVEEVYSLASS